MAVLYAFPQVEVRPSSPLYVTAIEQMGGGDRAKFVWRLRRTGGAPAQMRYPNVTKGSTQQGPKAAYRELCAWAKRQCIKIDLTGAKRDMEALLE